MFLQKRCNLLMSMNNKRDWGKQEEVTPGKQVQHLCGNSAGQISTGVLFLPMSWSTRPFLGKPSTKQEDGLKMDSSETKSEKTPTRIKSPRFFSEEARAPLRFYLGIWEQHLLKEKHKPKHLIISNTCVKTCLLSDSCTYFGHTKQWQHNHISRRLI